MITNNRKFNRKKIILVGSLGVLLLAGILLVACTSETPTAVVPPPTNTSAPSPVPVIVDVNQLYDNLWVLVGYGDPANPTVIEEGNTLTLQFTADGMAGGFSGCNSFSGPFQATTDGTLTFGPLASTLMACERGMDLETAYLSALQSSRSFNYDDQGRLLITYGAEGTPEQQMVFVIGAEPLVGTNWVLVSYGDPAAPQQVPENLIITAVFSQDGIMSGFSGCNQYTASYTVQDQQLTVGSVGMTRMSCESGMEEEQAYLQTLGTAQEFSITGKQLSITYNQGVGVATFTAANLPLEYTLWTLATMNGEPVPAEPGITAIFTPGEEANSGIITGSSGCNNYSSGYSVDGNNLTVQPAAMTMMACATGMDTEQAYLQALQASVSYEIVVDKLLLSSPTGTLVYTAQRTPLTGALWSLVALGDVEKPIPPVEGSNFAAQFNRIPGAPSGVLVGTTGCNEYTAAFAASIDEIKINTPASTTNTSCAPGLTDQEKLYFLALNDASTYRISGNTLVIPYDDDKQALVFEGTQLESASRPPLSSLNNTTWYLWYMDNTPIARGTTIYAQITINADGASGTLNGSAGCNNYVATFGQDLGVQTTLNAIQVCNTPAGTMGQETAYMNMIGRAYGYWVTGDQLILNTGLGVLTYRSTLPAESYDQTHLLVGETWFLVAHNESYSTPGTQEPFTLFNPDGTLTGYSGCNSFQGTYTTNTQAITIDGLNSTQAACPSAELDAQEKDMFGILNSALSYQVSGTAMQLTGDEGILTYSLSPLNRPEELIPPTAIFTKPSQAATNQVVRFDGSASTGQVSLVSYQWNFGDGWTGAGAVIDHVYANPGSYEVSLVVTDERGANDTEIQSIEIFVYVEPTPPPTAMPPTPTPGPTQPPQPTSTTEPTQPPQPTPTTEPTQPPAVPPQAAIVSSGDGYVGDPISFDASGSVAGSSPIVSYAWNFGDGTTAGPSPNPSQVTIFNDAGTYPVTVVVTDENGLSSSAVTEVVISARVEDPIEWMLAQLGSSGVLPGTTITIQFMAGQLQGFGGCNTYNGSYTASPNPDGTYNLTITGLFNTGMACPPDIMLQEGYYLAMLQSVYLASFDGNMLSLFFPAGTGPDGQPYPEGSLAYYQSGTLVPMPR